jgi:hypothetical protein
MITPWKSGCSGLGRFLGGQRPRDVFRPRHIIGPVRHQPVSGSLDAVDVAAVPIGETDKEQVISRGFQPDGAERATLRCDISLSELENLGDPHQRRLSVKLYVFQGKIYLGKILT